MRELLESAGPIPHDEWRFAEQFMRVTEIGRRAHLQLAGRPVERLYFLLEGVVRNYLVKDLGEERATGFVFAGDLAGDYESAIVTRTPATINVDALTRVRAVVFPPSMVEACYERHPCWDRVGRAMAERANVHRRAKEHRFRALTPEQHYHHLLTNRPHIVTRVPLRHLASYLGIRPETLSRIRKKRALDT
jgi:CRP/FNR family transcriptional regulator, anaerobic regulatory protein